MWTAINKARTPRRLPQQLAWQLTRTPVPVPFRYTPAMNLMTISQLLNEAYSKHKIVPDVLEKFDTHGLLTIEYGPKNHVTLGNTLKVADTQNKPEIQFTHNSPTPEADLSIAESDRFLLVMTDPDAPSNSDHKWLQYCHWIASDVALEASGSGDDLSAKLDFSSANDLVPYSGPAPPEKTGKHRYVFLLYRQDPKAHLVAPPDRPTWGTDVPGSGVREWIKKHGGGSQLLAVNFFYAENEVQE